MARRSDFQAIIQTYMDNMPSPKSFMRLVDSAMDAIRRIKINLNGQVFLLPIATCEQIPTLKRRIPKKSQRQSFIHLSLHRQNFGADRSEQITELYFDRDPLVFAAIVEYVTNKELHVPRDVCPKVFARDLIFWGFSIKDVESCCFSGLVNFLVQQDKIKDFQWFLYPKQPDSAPAMVTADWMARRYSSSDQTIRAKVWRILDEPNDSLPAKIYFTVMCFFILLSYFAIAASTHEYFQQKRETKEKPNTTNYQDNNGTKLSASISTDFSDSFFGVNIVIVYLEYVCSAYLFMDYVLRIIFFPDLRNFLKDPINITDGLALLSSLAKIIVKNFSSAYIRSWIQTIDIMQLLRILRFLRPMSKMTWFRLMYFTLRCSYKDLLLVVTLLLFLSMIFSSMLFYLGDKSSFKSIPEALWYSLITMTTVGYGDVVPKDLMSMLIGCVVAVFGVIVITMTTPIMVANFHSLYINAITGRPSTLKKVQKQPDHTVPQTSQFSPHTSRSRSAAPSFISPEGFATPPATNKVIDFDELSFFSNLQRSTRGSLSRHSWGSLGKSRGSVSGAINSMKGNAASFKSNEADARSGDRDLRKSLLFLERLGITQPSVVSEDIEASVKRRGIYPEASISLAAARENAPLAAPEIRLTVADDASKVSIGRRDGCDSDISIVDNLLESSMFFIQKLNFARANEDSEVVLSKGSSNQGSERADSQRRMQTDVPSEDIHEDSEVILSKGSSNRGSEKADSQRRMQTGVPSEDIHTERPSSTNAKNKTNKKGGNKGALSSISSGREADKDTDSPTSSPETQKPKNDDDDFNQNMMQRNRLLIRPRHRTWYANYDTSDTDTDSNWSARDWRVHFLDFIPYLEKAREEAMCHCRRTVKRRKKRPRR